MNDKSNIEMVDNQALETQINLKRPIVFEDQTVNQINLDFESLTGEDIEKAGLNLMLKHHKIQWLW